MLRLVRQVPAISSTDRLDVDMFSNRKRDRLHESHADDIVVTWLGGHETKGIEKQSTHGYPE